LSLCSVRAATTAAVPALVLPLVPVVTRTPREADDGPGPGSLKKSSSLYRYRNIEYDARY
jgi:hypothetical protein